MKVCRKCANEISAEAEVCPICRTHQSSGQRVEKAKPATAETSSEHRSSLPISTFGRCLLVAGALFSGGSFTMRTTVSTSMPSGLDYGTSTPSEVSNLGLLHLRALVMDAGIGMAIVGAIFVAAGMIVAELRDR